ncbi:MAG: hypothetical protein HPY76_09975 [Anaerolineae bacterium]|nr:hypothetical protein [Anaerolineae bacterium]
MSHKALFEGLIVDEAEHAVTVTLVGNEACYVVDDAGFMRHIPAEDVDRQVLKIMTDQVRGHEDILAEQTSKMLGQEDIFSRAILENQLKNIDDQIEQVLQTGIPEEGRAYMGMMGFKVVINVHGEVIRFDQPGSESDPDDE